MTNAICALVEPDSNIGNESWGTPDVGGHDSLPIGNNLGAGPVPTGTEAPVHRGRPVRAAPRG